MGRLFSVFLLAVVIFAGFYTLKTKNPNFDSPIPKVFGVAKKTETQINKWFPKDSAFDPVSKKLTVSARSALVVDYDTGKIIFQKNIEERLPVASTVKIMTALVALENKNLSDIFTVSEKGAKVGENSMGLTVGEKLSLKELLYGLILVSGNDAAFTIAEGVAGSEDKFVDLMNQKAKDLGLKDTKFVNSSGLDEDGKEQYSTVYDMTTIAHHLWENHPEFREISATVHQYIDSTPTHKSFDLYNDTNLLTTYPGVKGIKPGFTYESGLCLVTYAENQNKRILATVLGSNDRRGEMKELLDYGFDYFGIKISHPVLDL